MNRTAIAALLGLSIICSQANARPPTESAKITGALKSILTGLEIDTHTWGDNPDFRQRLDNFAPKVLDTRRWKVRKFEKQGNKITFDAYKITDRRQIITHGWRVQGTITGKRKADLEVWKLADGFCSGKFSISRNGRRASMFAGYDRPRMEVLTQRSMQLQKPVPGYKASQRRPGPRSRR